LSIKGVGAITTFSTHCSLDDDDLSCWNTTLNFYSKVLIGQLRHYIAVQVDIDQWHRRHGKPGGQDMDEVSDHVITWVPHFQCPIPCEYRRNNFRNLLIASVSIGLGAQF
ncbi:hypothetical protein ANCDUO_16246, partial [Ancylostoma duodenale]